MLRLYSITARRGSFPLFPSQAFCRVFVCSSTGARAARGRAIPRRPARARSGTALRRPPHPAGTIFPPNSSLLRAHSSILRSILRVPAVYLLLFCMGKEQSTRPQQLRYRQTLERKTKPEAVGTVSLWPNVTKNYCRQLEFGRTVQALRYLPHLLVPSRGARGRAGPALVLLFNWKRLLWLFVLYSELRGQRVLCPLKRFLCH